MGGAAASGESAHLTDRVLRSTKLEDSIYEDLRGGDEALDAIEQAAREKLSSFPALSRDVYQPFIAGCRCISFVNLLY